MSESTQPNFSTRANFTVDASLAPWNVPAKTYLVESQRDKELDGLCTANVIFNDEGKVLLIQRASHDSMPNKWEVPGGAVDDDDTTILYGAARELWEESQLIATHFTHIVAEISGRVPGQWFDPGQPPTLGHTFPNRDHSKMWCRFTFIAEVESCDDVKLDPNEHQAFLWASLEEVQEQMVGGREVPITTVNMRAHILEAFRLRQPRLPN